MLRDQLFDLRRDLRELRVVFSVEHRSGDQFADGVRTLRHRSPRVVPAAEPTRMPLVTKGERVSFGIVFLFTVRPTRSSSFSASLPVMFAGFRSTKQRWLSVPPETRRNPPSAIPLPSAAAILHHVLDIGSVFRLQRLLERDRLARDHVHERAALRTREHRLVDLGSELFVVGEDESTARTTQGLVARGRYDIGIGHRARMRDPWQRDQRYAPCRS